MDKTTINKTMPEIANLLQNAPLTIINRKRPIKSNLSLSAKKPKISNILSPNSEKIIQILSPDSKIRMRKKLFEDDKENYLQDDNDSDYLNQLKESEWGKNMEYVLCANGNCVKCKSKLLLIQQTNFPAVDLKCIKCNIWYQVKVSIGSSQYFSLKKKTISVGSVRYGSALHNIDYTTNNDIVLGYICINLDLLTDFAKINYRKSFTIIPENNGIAYKYLDSTSYFGKKNITWDSTVVKEYGLESVLTKEFTNININQQFDYVPF